MTDGQQFLRVMIVCRTLLGGVGGMERTAANLSNHLAQQGYETAIAHYDIPGKTSIYSLADNVERAPFDGTVQALVSIAGDFRPDVIVFFYASSVEAPHIAQLCETGIPVVLHEETDPVRAVNEWAIAKRLTLEQAGIERLAMMALCARVRFTLPQDCDSLPVALRDDFVPFPNAVLLADDDAALKRWGQVAVEESDIYAPELVFAEWEAVIADAAADRATPEERIRRRFGTGLEARRLRAVQRASLGVGPWPAAPALPFDEATPLVSIVIPLFNKEDYIAETLETVAASTYPKKEVIVVDDCSTDASARIAQEICMRHGWRLIRHELNGGLSLARNTGLDLAQGEYVHFWDADDLYSPEGIWVVLRAMHESCADIGTGVATRSGSVLEQYVVGNRDIQSVNYAQMPACFATASACFKVYRRAFLQKNDLRFEPGLYMQDSAFNMLAYPLAERITMTSAMLGEYRQVGNSSSRQFHPDRYASALRLEELTHDFYAAHGLHALDALRQEHVVSTVLLAFVRRARRGHGLIEAKMSPADLDFVFLGELQRRLPRLADGLAKMSRPFVALAYFAIREGYLIWLPKLLSRALPEDIRVDLLATTSEEMQLIDGLMAKARRAARSDQQAALQ